MTMGFMPSRNVSRDESLFITSASRGAALDAQAVVGREYALTGTTTRAIIARLICATVTPAVTYRLLGLIQWNQADGDEFTGVFRPALLGSATFGWGASPNRGLILNGDGAVEIQGLSYFAGVQRTCRHVVRLGTLALVAGNGCWAGFVRAADKTLLTGGGLGVNATPAYAGVAFVAQARATPALTAGTAFVGAPSLLVDQVIHHRADAFGATSASTVSGGGCVQAGGQQQISSTATGAGAADSNDHIPALSARGIPFRVLSSEFTGQVAA